MQRLSSNKFYRALSTSLANSYKVQIAYKPKELPVLTQSYYHNNGLDGQRLIDYSIDHIFRENVEKHPNKTAVINFSENNHIYTYSQFNEEIGKLADGLLSVGLKSGDKLAIWSPNIKEYPVVQMAAARLGIVLVTLNPLYTSQEAEFTLNFAECKAIICPRGILQVQNYLKHIEEMGTNAPKIQIVVNDCKLLNPNGEEFLPAPAGTIDYRDLVNSGQHDSDRVLAVRTESDNLGMIQFTSGTTGKPKAATLSYHNLVNNALSIQNRIRFYNGPICINVPLFHCFGNVGGSLMAALSGETQLYPFFGWNPNQTLTAIKETESTCMYGTPTMYVDMFQVIDNDPSLKSNLDSLKIGVAAASLVPPEIVKKANDEFGIDTIVAYGATELSPLVTQVYMDDTFEHKTDSVGRPIDHAEVKIIDSQGFTVPIGQAGELCSRGYMVFQGYLHDEERTKEAIDDARWYHTGDLAEMDSEGYIKIVGRIKDMIIRGGENVYPSEIEDIILAHDDILDVQVVGAPDYRLGEVVAAYLRLSDSAKNKSEEEVLKSVKEFCGEQLAKFKIPKHWKVLDVFPCTLSGKVKKFELRDRCKDDFKLKLS